jgi:hypothetical protein
MKGTFCAHCRIKPPFMDAGRSLLAVR